MSHNACSLSRLLFHRMLCRQSPQNREFPNAQSRLIWHPIASSSPFHVLMLNALAHYAHDKTSGPFANRTFCTWTSRLQRSFLNNNYPAPVVQTFHFLILNWRLFWYDSLHHVSVLIVLVLVLFVLIFNYWLLNSYWSAGPCYELTSMMTMMGELFSIPFEKNNSTEEKIVVGRSETSYCCSLLTSYHCKTIHVWSIKNTDVGSVFTSTVLYGFSIEYNTLFDPQIYLGTLSKWLTKKDQTLKFVVRPCHSRAVARTRRWSRYAYVTRLERNLRTTTQQFLLIHPRNAPTQHFSSLSIVGFCFLLLQKLPSCTLLWTLDIPSLASYRRSVYLLLLIVDIIII